MARQFRVMWGATSLLPVPCNPWYRPRRFIRSHMRDFNDRAQPPPNRQKDLVNLITGLAPRYGAWQVFTDFVEMAAISISNAVDLGQREPREARYLEIVKRYKREEVAK